jgi:DNA-binding response OmpR family regulator
MPPIVATPSLTQTSEALRLDEPPSGRPELALVPSPEPAPVAPPGATVLVVDDDPSVRRLLELALRLEGFTVMSAADGEAALDCARIHHPGAIVLDAVMPGVDGIEVCRRLRSELGWGQAILMLTGRTDVADRRTAFESGADDYVVKPVRVTELVEKVKRHLEQAPTATGPARLLGGPEAYDHLRRRMEATEAVEVLSVKVGGLPAFSRHYSFARADRVLRWLGDVLLGLAAARPGTVVGRLGAGDFLVVSAPETGDALVAELLDAFDACLPSFYDPADAERGWIEVTDRMGRTDRGRLTLAIGVSSNEGNGVGHHLDLLQRAAEMADYAGARGTDRVGVDRRRA